MKPTPNDIRQILDKAYSLCQTNEYKEGMAWLDKILALNPNHEEALFIKSSALIRLGNHVEAIAQYEVLIHKSPDNPYFYYNKGTFLSAIENYDQAIQCFDKAIQLKDDFIDAYFNKATILNQLNRCYEALNVYDDIISFHPEDPSVYFSKGNTLSKLTMYDEAIDCYEKTAALKPEFASAYFNNANAHSIMGRLKQAVKLYDKAISINSEDASYHFNKSTALHALGKREEAIQVLNKIIIVEPGHHLALWNKANILMEVGIKEDALKVYNEAVTVYPYNSFCYCSRGFCLDSIGKDKEALEDFKKAQSLIEINHENNPAIKTRSLIIKCTLNLIVGLFNIIHDVETVCKESNQDVESALHVNSKLRELNNMRKQVTGVVIKELNSINNDNLIKRIKKLEQIYMKFFQKGATLQKSAKCGGVGNKETLVENLRVEFKTGVKKYYKELYVELKNTSLTEQEILRLMAYFNGFTDTLAGVFITFYLINTKNIEVVTRTHTALIFSTLASILPYIENIAMKNNNTMSEVLQNKKIKGTVNKFKNLVKDKSKFYQIVGRVATTVIMDVNKRQTILAVKEQEQQDKVYNDFFKLTKIADSMKESMSFSVYLSLYQEPAVSFGHNDAKKIIHEWLNRKISQQNIEEQFINLIVSQEDQKHGLKALISEVKNEEPVVLDGNTRHCNVF